MFFESPFSRGARCVQIQMPLPPRAAFLGTLLPGLLLVIWSGANWAAEEGTRSGYWRGIVHNMLALLAVVVVVQNVRKYRKAPNGWIRPRREGVSTNEITAGRDQGCVTTFICKVTAVCANRRPFTVAPVARVMPVLPSTIPSMCAVVPSATTPADCQ